MYDNDEAMSPAIGKHCWQSTVISITIIRVYYSVACNSHRKARRKVLNLNALTALCDVVKHEPNGKKCMPKVYWSGLHIGLLGGDERTRTTRIFVCDGERVFEAMKTPYRNTQILIILTKLKRTFWLSFLVMPRLNIYIHDVVVI